VERAEVAEAADALYQRLQEAGIETLYDDRAETPGVKFNDADLLGMPLRATVSPRTLEKGAVELKGRAQDKGELVPLDQAVSAVRAHIAA